ncbi:eukaryotic translation initiation factor 4G-like isoform X2 [Asparagus officinalis]|uniref:eukaryotic translation initiation factor 4G-like isoform X2 n=1 Tax=Asparagus officinalis TaxID=4686 RepID=UPI00098E5170|nr:eukaryotic translation initiation factor 4G-like isoform X2 [Asparagus officinalis]
MSQNQTRGRSSNPRGFSGGRGRGRAQPPVSSNSSASRSLKKSGNGQSRATPIGTNQVPVSSQGSSELRTSNAGSRPIPKAPSSQPSHSATPPKGGASRESFPLQFGSISPGIMNKMQIPARTSSAPPNLDEQKNAQAHHDSFRTKSTMPPPTALKEQQQQMRNDVTGLNQSSTRDSHPQSQTNRDVHVPISLAPASIPPKSSVLPIGGMPMHLPFQQPQVPIQFGGPSPQMQPQGVTFNSLQMPMALPIAQAPQQFFVPSIPSHPLQQPTMMHQGQGLGFAHQIGHQMPSQLGNLGFGIGPQFSQPQPVTFVGTRRSTVKITHPDTHEELKLDMHKESKASNQKLQAVLTFSSSHQTNYHSTMQANSYNPSPILNPTSNSQMTTGSQGPRYRTPVGQNGQTILFSKQSVHNPISGNKPEQSLQVSAPPSVRVTIRPAVNSFEEKTGSIHQTEDEHSTTAPSSRISSSHLTPVGDSIQRSDSIKEQEGRTSKRAYHQQQNKPDVLDSEGMTKTISKSIKDSSDMIAQEKLEFLSLSNSSASITGLPFPAVQHENSAESKIKAVPSLSESYRVTLEKEVSGDSSICSAVSLELATNRYLSEEGDSHEASTSLDSKAGRTISEISDSASNLHENTSAETEKAHEDLALNGKSEVSADLQDSTSAGSYPVSTAPDSLETVNTTATRENEEIVVDKPEEKASHVLCHGEEQPGTGQVVHCRLEVEMGEKKTDVLSSFSESKHTGYPLSSSHAAEDKPSGPDSILNKFETESSQDSLQGSVSLGHKHKLDGEVTESSSREGLKDKPNLDPVRSKVNAGKKKKLKDILSRADAAGSSDLYNAYKGPEEKNSVVDTSESIDDSLTVDAKNVLADDHNEDVLDVEVGQITSEIDDWEDAADVSSPDLAVENIQQAHKNETTSKKSYTIDFLLTFSEQSADLPVGFEIESDIANALMVSPVRTYPSPGRILDRSPYHGNDEKWTKAATGFGIGHDIRLNMGYAVANISSRPAQGVNNLAVRHSRAHPSTHFASGILPGPMQPLSNADSDRWQRAIGAQRGFIPSPHAPSQIMHKAANKYEIGKVSDIEQAKQRQLKAILNKLTPQNFEKLFLQVKEVNIDNTVTLTGVISQIFDKALSEPTFCEMYANFCACLSNELPDFVEDNEKITFKRLLLNKCQEEFERGEREEEAGRIEKEGESKQTAAQREEKRIKARRRMLGNIRLIGELYKKRMLTERIMHACIQKLLGEYQDPDEEDLESLCKLMSTIGAMIDHAKAKEHMDAYFDRISKLSTHPKLLPRTRFLLRDTIDLRKNNWKERRKVEGPKKIDEVHRDAAHERQAQAGRLARGPVITSGPRRGPPADYNLRGSALLSSPNSQQIGAARGLPTQFRGYTNQDTRADDRNHFESRVLSVPLPKRTTDDNSITLGPQGGLARGMSIRGESMLRDFRIDVNDKSASTNPSGRIHGSSSGIVETPSQSKFLSEEDLREKSVSAIREFYSAKDEEEVALCIKELNSPSFYSSMISLWIADSFERKETERDLLAKLLISLCKHQNSLFSHFQLIQGFEYVLSSLEDAVNDAPKAPEFLGHIFAKIALEDVVSLRDIGKIIYEGGEEPGSLLESGLASEVLGCVLEFIKMAKGDSMLREICLNSNLKLEDFIPRHPTKNNKLAAFL